MSLFCNVFLDAHIESPLNYLQNEPLFVTICYQSNLWAVFQNRLSKGVCLSAWLNQLWCEPIARRRMIHFCNVFLDTRIESPLNYLQNDHSFATFRYYRMDIRLLQCRLRPLPCRPAVCLTKMRTTTRIIRNRRSRSSTWRGAARRGAARQLRQPLKIQIPLRAVFLFFVVVLGTHNPPYIG